MTIVVAIVVGLAFVAVLDIALQVLAWAHTGIRVLRVWIFRGMSPRAQRRFMRRPFASHTVRRRVVEIYDQYADPPEGR